MGGGFYLWESGLKQNRADRLQRGFESVHRSFRRLLHLAHDVFYYVRDRRMNPEVLDGAALLRAVVEDLQEDVPWAGATVKLGGDLPSRMPLKVDRRAFRSALTNLAVSALEDCFGDKGDRAHQVLLSAHVEGNDGVFVVEDNGRGMDQEALEKVFSLFFDPKGIEAAGVGLYITNKLARLLGGRVEIDSELGKGTRYALRLPLVEE
jgi:signal transduction histidine kinase